MVLQSLKRNSLQLSQGKQGTQIFLKGNVESAEENSITGSIDIKKIHHLFSLPPGIIKYIIVQLEALYFAKTKFRNPGMLQLES